eukprot:965853_1
MAQQSIGISLLQNKGKGWKIDLFSEDNVKKEYVCCYCDNICKDTVELSCDADHDDDDIQLYCQQCLETVLSSNDGNCPINNHAEPTFAPSRRIRSKIKKAKVLCPNSVQYQQQKLNESGNVIDTGDEKEGSNIAGAMKRIKGCEFNGCLSELLGHISGCCESNLVSNEMQSEVIAMLRKEIGEIKNENKVMMNHYEQLQTTVKNQHQEIHELSQKVASMDDMKQTVAELNKKVTSMDDMKQIVAELNKRVTSLEGMKQTVDELIEKVAALANVIQSKQIQEPEQKELVIDSNILSMIEHKPFIELFLSVPSTLELVYRASRDGYAWNVYYDKLGNKAPSVCIIHAENNYVFGGYTKVIFNRHAGSVIDSKDDDAFIFSIRRKGSVLPQKWSMNTSAAYAVRMATTYGPIFGTGHSWYLNGGMKSGHCNPRGKAFGLENIELLAGKTTYKVMDVELFVVR